RSQLCEPCRDIAAQMHMQRAAAPLAKNFEIAARLRRFYDAERILLARHRNIARVVAGDLHEHARIRPPFVRLPGRVEKSRPESQACRRFLRVANLATDLLS